MRHVLIEHARNQLASKRRTGAEHAPVMTDTRFTAKALELLELDEALDRLASLDKRKSTVVELRYFGGLTVAETAEVLQVSQVSIVRDWRFAKAWLKRELSLEETPKLDVSIPIEALEVATTGDDERTLAEAWSNRALVATLMTKNWAGLRLLVQLRLNPNVTSAKLVAALGIHRSIVDSLLFKLAEFQALEKQHDVFTLTHRGYVLLQAFEKRLGKSLNE